MSGPDYGYPIISEAIEPVAAMLVGRMFARCETVKDNRCAFESLARQFWFVMSGLNRIAIGVGTATHFSVAVMNEQSRVAKYIESVLGVNPLFDKEGGWE